MAATNSKSFDLANFDVEEKEQKNDRRLYKSFWDKYSDRADITSMMLNANADELENLDRLDVVLSLPNFTGKNVVDVGAGIGRFTTVFAKYAKTVISSDFIANFIEKNRERNSAFTNVEYRVSDALGLNLPSMSADLVFTNWLLMYLSDNEAIQFIQRALNWLRPGGFLHIRESCSEPSTKKPFDGGSNSSDNSNASLHQANAINPTRYRFSSAYIQLFKNIHTFDDKTNTSWGFSIKWACSVPVYIDRLLNWRQIHWLLEKVPLSSDSPAIRYSDIDLHKSFSFDWPNEQEKYDSYLLEHQRSTNEIFAKILSPELINPGSVIFSYVSPNSPINLRIDPHFLSKYYDSRVWNVEWNPFYYRQSLSVANKIGDRRIRLAYSENLENALDYWLEGRSSSEKATFDLLFGVGLLSALKTSELVKKVTGVLRPGAKILSLEIRPRQSSGAFIYEIEALLRESFHINSITNVTQFTTNTMVDQEFEWFLLNAELRSSVAKEYHPNHLRQNLGAINRGF